MKKILLLFLGGIFSLMGVTQPVSKSGVDKILRQTESSYAINDFSSLPEDWCLYSLCDVSHTTTTYSNSEMIITHNNSGINNSLYYGSLYEIGVGKAWSDFTFEMDFRMSNPADNYRWLGVMYHTNYVGDNITGYMMNYRYGGESASSTIDSSKGFTDSAKETGLVKLSDGNYHTLKIVMEGNLASHYIDDTLIKTYDVSTQNVYLGKTYTSGGFALIVNRSTVNISRVSILGEKAEISTSTVDRELVSTYEDENVINNEATVVLNVETADDLTSLTNEERKPSNVILTIDKNMNVVDKNNVVIDTFDNVFELLDKKVIPILNISSEEVANAYIKYFKEEKDILDMAILSKNVDLLNKIKNENYKVRAILEFGEITDLYEVVRLAQEAKAYTVILPQQYASVENVRYIQARFKTVWTRLNSTSEIDLYDALASGSYGLVSNNYLAVYDFYSELGDVVTRRPFNVAHRGVVNICNENSLSGIQMAAEYGATHVELDVYVTTDNEIVLMHDDTIDRTTNGSGKIENMSYAQLSNYNLDLYGEEIIPTLDEAIDEILQTDLVLVLEIKSSRRQLIEVLKDKIELDENYQAILKQMVIITFNVSQLVNLKELLPQIPAANLNTSSKNSFASNLESMGLYNCLFDTNLSSANVEFNEQYLRDRGIIGWFWTYQSSNDVLLAMIRGFVGLTNNAPLTLNDYIMYVKGKENLITNDELSIGDDILIDINLYGVDDYDDYAQIISIEETETSYYVVAEYYEGDQTFFTNKFEVKKGEVLLPIISSNDSPETWLIILISLGSVALIGGITTFFIIKSRRKKDMA